MHVVSRESYGLQRDVDAVDVHVGNGVGEEGVEEEGDAAGACAEVYDGEWRG